ncbi:F-box protein [Legionella dresdenensis]|uniref:F-box protein n=1 Tax=Legionella dresdenensis TaxID=450200 RepID=A0ABV8CE26_9GAMM
MVTPELEDALLEEEQTLTNLNQEADLSETDEDKGHVLSENKLSTCTSTTSTAVSASASLVAPDISGLELFSSLPVELLQRIVKQLDPLSVANLRSSCRFFYDNSRNLAALHTFQRFKVKAISGGNRHTCLLTKNNELYVCGDNNTGQLGLGDTKEKPHFTRVNLEVLLTTGEVITQISSGNWYTVFLTNKSRVFSSGYNTNGKTMGLPGDECNLFKEVTTISIDKNQTIDFLFCITKVTILITSNKKLWIYGEIKQNNLSNPIDLSSTLNACENIVSATIEYETDDSCIVLLTNNQRIISVVIGQEQWEVRTNDLSNGLSACQSGKLFFAPVECDNRYWVKNTAFWTAKDWCQFDFRMGELKISKELLPFTESDETIVAATAGDCHTLCLSSKGRVYGKGLNTSGQLGADEDIKDYKSWRLLTLELDKGEKITHIESSCNTSFLTTNKNRLFVAGDNEAGQLGLGHKKPVYHFQEVIPRYLQQKDVIEPSSFPSLS